MKTLRSSIDSISGLRFVINSLDLASSLGRQAVLETSWTTSLDGINKRLSRVTRFYTYLTEEKKREGLKELYLLLQGIRNVSGSIGLLREKRSSCSDVDLYELKCLALLSLKVARLCRQYNLELEPMPSLEKALDILDIDGERLPSFYISDAYSASLAAIRKEIECATSESKRDELAIKASQEEDRVRRRLTKELAPFADDFSHVLAALASDDMLLAKARWAFDNHCCCPTPLASEADTHITALVHPEVASKVETLGDVYQPVSIHFGAFPTLITGANMAGKSVLLSAVTLAQCLMQYGFYVPAKEAQIAIVEEILCSMGDGQNFDKGLSSFGAEVLRLDQIVQVAKQGISILAPIDEPARTTNPEEGEAIVDALVRLFAQYRVRSIITTHYSGIKAPCTKYRVRGFIEKRMQLPLEINKLNNYIDYALVEDISGEAPHEAIRIAEILGIDKELLQYCKENLNQ
ncbi:MAG: DNA mismatch repair protein MutS [Porphyromonas sp.]|nr:DNA mismatch repair protein MutS [Porphyromonas sp.]